jgi:DnaJ-class molecular chaperone
VTGSKKGDWIKLAQAMHRVDANQSCIGCHDTRQKQPQCAGCHASIQRPTQNNTATCEACHLQPAESAVQSAPDSAVNQQAAVLLESQHQGIRTYPDADVPETVMIRALSDQYEGAKLPHRKIVRTLEAKIASDKLAGYFHREQGTLCQGCHHQSPPAAKPPKCASCHGKPFDNGEPTRPGLMAAYHQQCMTCHEKMQMEHPAATNCTVCHKKK